MTPPVELEESLSPHSSGIPLLDEDDVVEDEDLDLEWSKGRIHQLPVPVGYDSPTAGFARLPEEAAAPASPAAALLPSSAASQPAPASLHNDSSLSDSSWPVLKRIRCTQFLNRFLHHPQSTKYNSMLTVVAVPYLTLLTSQLKSWLL